jgi:hypothetical protein
VREAGVEERRWGDHRTPAGDGLRDDSARDGCPNIPDAVA